MLNVKLYSTSTKKFVKTLYVKNYNSIMEEDANVSLLCLKELLIKGEVEIISIPF